MANESKPGFEGKVTLGANTVLGMGVWTHDGFTAEMLDDTEFGDKYDDFLYGLIHCGKVTFNGKFKVYEVNGPDIKAVNDFDKTTVTTAKKPEINISGARFTYSFPPHSFTLLKGKIKR